MIYGANSKKPPCATVSPGSGSRAMRGIRITNDATSLLLPKIAKVRRSSIPEQLAALREAFLASRDPNRN